MMHRSDSGGPAGRSRDPIPTERRRLNPLMTSAGWANYLRLKQHGQAPIWNFDTGDRITAADLAAVERFRRQLDTDRTGMPIDRPPQWMPAWLAQRRQTVPAFTECIPNDLDPLRDWWHVGTTSREDLAARIDTLVPLDADLSRLIVYDTSGTSGHAMVVPHHPAAMGKAMALVERVLRRFGIEPEFGPQMTACINVCAQVQTVVFPHVASVWGEAGFVKLNLHPDAWRQAEDAHRFFQDAAPLFLTGDPVAFAELLAWDLPTGPRLMLSTAVTMTGSLRERLNRRFDCPVVDWYSLTEVGPVGYTCREHCGFHLLSPDLFVEILDEDGWQLPTGEVGEITVTGGRNPYLPLLRYRTGDRAAIDDTPCPCGDPMPRLVAFEGRAAVRFQAVDGGVVNPVDIGRVLRDHPILQHEFIQRADGSCDCRLRPVLPDRPPAAERIRRRLAALFGPEAIIRVHIDPDLGRDRPGGKVLPYRSEMAEAPLAPD
jgi:phenylacetate-CoA ligase